VPACFNPQWYVLKNIVACLEAKTTALPVILDHSVIQYDRERRRFLCWRMSLSVNRIPPRRDTREDVQKQPRGGQNEIERCHCIRRDLLMVGITEAQRTFQIRRLITTPWRPAPLASVFAFHEIQPLPQLEQGGAPARANLADRPNGVNRPNWFYRGIIHDVATLRLS